MLVTVCQITNYSLDNVYSLENVPFDSWAVGYVCLFEELIETLFESFNGSSTCNTIGKAFQLSMHLILKN